MKSLKTKILSASLILLALLVGCSKKAVTIINDPEIEQSLYGTWAVSSSGESQFWTGPNIKTEKFLGKATIRTENTISFSKNHSFEMSNNSIVESLTIPEDSSLEEEVLRPMLEKSVSIKGSFSVDKDYLELRRESVLVNGSESYTAEEYSKIDNNFGSVVQVEKWKLSGNTLTVSDSSSESDISYERQ